MVKIQPTVSWSTEWTVHADYPAYTDPLLCFRSYVNSTTAFTDGLAYVNKQGQVIMKADNTSTLQAGQNRAR